MRTSPFLDQESILYPSSDGKPLADNTLQLRWIVYLYSNLQWWFRNPNIFIAADLLWYPVQGQPRINKAPDVMVVKGRPDGDRLSYRQWLEEDTPPQVVMEVLSSSNKASEMIDKQHWYARYGVQEFIIIDPDQKQFTPMLRQGDQLVKPDLPQVSWQSPNLGIWFRRVGNDLKVFFPDETLFKTLTESQLEAEAARLKAEEANAKAEEANVKAEKAELEAEAAKSETEKARREAEEQRERAKAAELELERLRQQLREQGE